MEQVTIQANAKINLALAVKHRRPDGFHEIESVFQEIDFGDRLELAPADRIHFESDLEQLNRLGDNNSCLRAAQLLQQVLKFPGVSIKLTKNIPLGSGLGGGSSDAAAVLRGLATLFKGQIPAKHLWQLALQIGSDVPFFLQGKTAHVTGRGEIIRPLTTDEDYFIVLVMPGIHCSTPQAYKNLKRGLTKVETKFKFIGLGIYKTGLTRYRSVFYNDFEKPIFSSYPQLAEIKDSCYRLGADFAAMSGSGSALFGLFKQEATAHQALKHFASIYPCVLTKPVLNKR